MENTKKIKLELTVEQVNIVLESLQKGVYAQVKDLVETILEQGKRQIEESKEVK